MCVSVCVSMYVYWYVGFTGTTQILSFLFLSHDKATMSGFE